MSFETMQSALQTLLATVSGYTTANITLADYRVLQRGYEKIIVLRPGAFTRDRLDFAGGRDNIWNVIVELFIKYKDDAQVQNAIRDERQNIIDKIDQYSKLNNTSGCFHAMIISGAEPTPVFGEDGSGPHFFMQEMTCKIIEYSEVTEAE